MHACTVSRPSCIQVYRSGMQQTNAGSTKARFALRWCPCASCIWLLHPAPIDLCPRWSWHCATCAGVFSFLPLAQILHLHSWWSSPTATCAGGVFSRSTSAFTDVHIETHLEDNALAWCIELSFCQRPSKGSMYSHGWLSRLCCAVLSSPAECQIVEWHHVVTVSISSDSSTASHDITS